MLLFESSSIETLKDYLISKRKACEYGFDDALEKAGEENTILLLTEKMKDIVHFEELEEILTVKEEPDVLLCALMNDGMNTLIKNARIAPRIIILRGMGDMERIIEDIKKDHRAVEGGFFDTLSSHNDKGTVLALTDKPLHRNLSVKDLYIKTLFVEESYYSLFPSLRMHALKYLNTGLQNKDWYEVEIRIYDRYSAYMLHYERLLKVLDSLELGLILGESWSKDYPRFLMAVGVYRVRFFTFQEPKYIKRVLVGLEYLEDGTRIVDYDVYYYRKKIDWTDATDGVKTRHLLSEKYRKEIFSKLSSQEAEEILGLEEEILKTRT